MKYNININQKAFIELSSEKIDIVDATILDFIINFCREENPRINEKRLIIKDNQKEEIFTWIDRNLINLELPLLRFKQNESISQRLRKLQKEGFIKIKTIPSSEGKRLYIRITYKTLQIQFEQPTQSRLFNPPNLDLIANQSRLDNHYHNNIININKSDIAETSSAVTKSLVFLLKEELNKLKKSPQRHIQLIGEYLEEKKIQIENKDQLKVAIKRHLRAATDLAKFSDKKIGEATVIAEKDYPQYTLETLVKILTR